MPSGSRSSTGTTRAIRGRSARNASADEKPANASSAHTCGGIIRTSQAAARDRIAAGSTHPPPSDSPSAPSAQLPEGNGKHLGQAKKMLQGDLANAVTFGDTSLTRG